MLLHDRLHGQHDNHCLGTRASGGYGVMMYYSNDFEIVGNNLPSKSMACTCTIRTCMMHQAAPATRLRRSHW